MNFQRESLSESLWTEMLPLFEAQWREMAAYPDIPLDIDRDYYDKLHAVRILRVFTAREGRTLAGVQVFLVKGSPHYQCSPQAFQDLVYLLPLYRLGLVGLDFLRFADNSLREEGVQVIYRYTKSSVQFGPVLDRLEYEKIDEAWGRRLDKGGQ